MCASPRLLIHSLVLFVSIVGQTSRPVSSVFHAMRKAVNRIDEEHRLSPRMYSSRESLRKMCPERVGKSSTAMTRTESDGLRVRRSDNQNGPCMHNRGKYAPIFQASVLYWLDGLMHPWPTANVRGQICCSSFGHLRETIVLRSASRLCCRPLLGCLACRLRNCLCRNTMGAEVLQSVAFERSTADPDALVGYSRTLGAFHDRATAIQRR